MTCSWPQLENELQARLCYMKPCLLKGPDLSAMSDGTQNFKIKVAPSVGIL